MGCWAAEHEHRVLLAVPQLPRKAAPSPASTPSREAEAAGGPQPWHGDAGRSLPQLPLFSESLETKGERSGWKLCTLPSRKRSE